MKYLKNLSYTKIAYDSIISIVSLAIAFCCRAALDIVTQGSYTAKQYRVFNGYINHFQDYFLPFTIITIVSLGVLGFYWTNHSKPLRGILFILCAASLPTLLFGVLVYFTAPQPDFSRGVMLFLWAVSSTFIATPRLIRYYAELDILNRKKSKNSRPRNILIIGGAGYVGSQLSTDLLKRGFRVRVLDSIFFGEGPLKELKKEKRFELQVGDFRNVQTMVNAMKDIDAVVHLAGIVGDPACSLDNDFTIEVNLSATSMVAEVCKTFKIQRLIFASTCSVYGQSKSGKPLDENSTLNPVSLYAKTKIASEKVLERMKTKDFQPTILRFATLFGLSPRPRFDLVVNILAAKAAALKEINVFGGNQWRPFVHVSDISKAIIATLESPIHKVGGEIFNIGSNTENHKIIDVGNMVAELVPGTKINVDHSMEDERNYNVCFDKFNKALKTSLDVSVKDGILEIAEAIKSKKILNFQEPVYSNVKRTESVILECVNTPEAQQSSLKKTSKTLLKEVDH